MTFLKAAPTVLCLAVLGTAFSPIAKADEWNRKTIITFSEPVEIPGVHLKELCGSACRNVRLQDSGL